MTALIILLLFAILCIMAVLDWKYHYKHLYNQKNNIVPITPKGINFLISKELVKKDDMRFNTLNFCKSVTGIQLVTHKTPFTIQRTRKGFLIITAYSSNRKSKQKMYEIYVCDEILPKLFSPHMYERLIREEEIDCIIDYKHDQS